MSDLMAARCLLKEADDAVLQQAAYHLQQSVEKALKYCYTHKGLKVPKTHDIRAILEGFPRDPVLEESLDALEIIADTLTMWEEKTRYPNDYMATRRSIVSVLPLVEKLLSSITIFVAPVKKSNPLGSVKRLNLLD